MRRNGRHLRFIQAQGSAGRTSAGGWRDRHARSRRWSARRYDATREAIVEAILRCPPPLPDRLFPWFRAVASRHALTQLRKDLTDARTSMSAAEEALQLALAGFEDAVPPTTSERAGLWMWPAHTRARRYLRDRRDVLRSKRGAPDV